jgi:antitoxin ParD1/3/4
MNEYRCTPGAEDDLFEIWRYIARDSVAAANRVESAIHDACFFLAQKPQSGSQRRDVTTLPVHFWTVQQYPN